VSLIGGLQGDSDECFRCAVATLLQISLKDLPEVDLDDDDWPSKFARDLRQRYGVRLELLPRKRVPARGTGSRSSHRTTPTTRTRLSARMNGSSLTRAADTASAPSPNTTYLAACGSTSQARHGDPARLHQVRADSRARHQPLPTAPASPLAHDH
jgi:hypothetical protein